MIVKQFYVPVKKFWEKKPESFTSFFNPKNNAIGFMRTFFALLVILHHAYPLGGYTADHLTRLSLGQSSFGSFAVNGFFILSGYLIAASFISSKSLARYSWHRFLRIMPAFWVALIVVAFFFAPLMSYLQVGSLDNFRLSGDRSAISYVKDNSLLDMKQYDISGLTSKLPWPNAFNGSLWTLIYEVTAYFLVAALGVVGILKKRSLYMLAMVAFIYILYILSIAVPGSLDRIAQPLADPQAIKLMLMFFVGSIWYLFKDSIVMSNKIAVFAVIIALFAYRNNFWLIIEPAIFSYLIFYFSMMLPFKNFDRKADFSYGIYIYAFPVQQLLAQLSVHKIAGPYFFAIVAAALTLPFAIASFYLIEKPALRYKNSSLRRRKK